MPKPHKMSHPRKMHGPYMKERRANGLWHVLGSEEEDYDTIAAEVTVEDIADLLVQELTNQDEQAVIPRKLTLEAKLDYYKNPHKCPYCDNTRLDTGPFTIDGFGIDVTVHVTCMRCKKEWLDVHKLLDIRPLN